MKFIVKSILICSLGLANISLVTACDKDERSNKLLSDVIIEQSQGGVVGTTTLITQISPSGEWQKTYHLNGKMVDEEPFQKIGKASLNCIAITFSENHWQDLPNNIGEIAPVNPSTTKISYQDKEVALQMVAAKDDNAEIFNEIHAIIQAVLSDGSCPKE